MNESEKARKLDLLNYQILELEKARLRAGEEAELLERRDILRSAADLTEAVQGAHYALSGDDDAPGAASLLAQAVQALERVSGISSDLDDILEKLEELNILAQDAADSARNVLDHFEADPLELDRIEARLDQLYRLKKKYGETEEKMLDFLQKCQDERDEIQFADDALARLGSEYQTALEEAQKRAKVLSEARKSSAKVLEKRIQDELAQLDMPKVRFQVEFSPLSRENGEEIGESENKIGLNRDGMDAVRFLMSANVGEALKPIQKIASGGELARIMLCLKNVLAEGDGVDTLVFDEVDTGVSGRAAQKVAQKLCQVARHKQVLCVTHLPQIAAMADVHFSVEKGEKAGRTYTDVEQLSRERRQAELARLTAGEQITRSALDSAAELLDAAEAYKKAL